MNVNGYGRLTRDAEPKYTQSGMAIANFSIAWNSRKKQGDSWVNVPHYYDCTIMGKLAEAIVKYLVKGKEVVISGKLHQDRWTDTSGNNRSKHVIMVDDIHLCGDRGEKQEVFEDDIPL